MSVNYYDKDNDQLTKLAGSSALVMDSTPSSGSTNPVTSNGIYEALATKQNTLSFDSTPTASSTNPVTSGGVKTALDAKLAKSTVSDAYNSATQYGIEGNSNGYPTYCINNDVVYECISACIGVAPPNATYWTAHPLAEWIGQLNSNLVLKKTQMTFILSDYTKTRTYYAIPITGNHLFATLADFSSGGLQTSPFTICYEGASIYIIVGDVEPTSVIVNFWSY